MNPIIIGTLISAGVEISTKILADIHNRPNDYAKQFQVRMEFYEVFVSLYGRAARTDGIVQEEEKKLFIDNLRKHCFSDAEDFLTFSPKLLKKMKKSKDDVVNTLKRKFQTPDRLEKICQYAINKGVETIFYTHTVQLLASDKILYVKERKFLDELANGFKISKNEKKMIESQLLKESKVENKIVGTVKNILKRN